MNAHVAGVALGGTLATFEFAMLVAVFCFREKMIKKFPRMTAHMGIGVKTTSYRFFAGLDTFLVSWFMTGNPLAATGIVGLELVTKFFLFYGHEWLWSWPFLAKLTMKPAKA
jgi:uncharacterized membrane protein